MNSDKISEADKEESAQELTKDELISQTASDYSKYLDVNITHERQQFEESIEGMLTRLDEYLGLVSLIRSDTSLCLETTLPVIQAKSVEMTRLFERIDQLESFVGIVHQTVNLLEEHVVQAEAEIGSSGALRKMLTSISMPSFLSKNKQQRKPKAGAPWLKFTPPEIYHTSDYIHYPVRSASPAGKAANIVQSSQGSSPSKAQAAAPSRDPSAIVPAAARASVGAASSWPEIGST